LASYSLAGSREPGLRREDGPVFDELFDRAYAPAPRGRPFPKATSRLSASIEQQSAEGDRERRKQLVWAIGKRLAEDFARPIIFHTRGGTCRHPWVKGLTLMVSSIFLGNRRQGILGRQIVEHVCLRRSACTPH
jgi:hypothetical protein